MTYARIRCVPGVLINEETLSRIIHRGVSIIHYESLDYWTTLPYTAPSVARSCSSKKKRGERERRSREKVYKMMMPFPPPLLCCRACIHQFSCLLMQSPPCASG